MAGIALVLTACGGTATPADDASGRVRDAGGPHVERPDVLPMTESDVGAMDEYAVAKTAKGLRDALGECIDAPGQKKSYLGGEITVVVHVKKGGGVVDAVPQKSTIGDRSVEACILGAFERAPWPSPVGGKVGEVRQEFGFPPRGRAALNVEPSRLGGQAMTARNLLGECGTGDLTVTFYLDPDGKPLGAGAATSDPAVLSQLDCASRKLDALRFPSPGSWNGKVTLRR